MEIVFDQQLVQNFMISIRKKGAAVLSSSPAPFSAQHLSTPALTWLLAHRNVLPKPEKLTKVLSMDIERQKTVIGHNIFKDPRIAHYPSEECHRKTSLEIIQKVWPQFHALIETIQPRISFQTEDRKQFESESDPKTFGEIIFNMKNPCPVHWSEILVHEIAHHYLTVLLATNEINSQTLLKLKKRYHSYQRNCERPLIGILHGVVAQSCILIFATNILLNSEFFSQWGSGAQKTFDRYASIFKSDLNTIQTQELLFHRQIEALSKQALLQTLRVESKGEMTS